MRWGVQQGGVGTRPLARGIPWHARQPLVIANRTSTRRQPRRRRRRRHPRRPCSPRRRPPRCPLRFWMRAEPDGRVSSQQPLDEGEQRFRQRLIVAHLEVRVRDVPVQLQDVVDAPAVGEGRVAVTHLERDHAKGPAHHQEKGRGRWGVCCTLAGGAGWLTYAAQAGWCGGGESVVEPAPR
eukprot:scaffold16163_cov106-Isochrysis_galbana.AAC.2